MVWCEILLVEDRCCFSVSSKQITEEASNFIQSIERQDRECGKALNLFLPSLCLFSLPLCLPVCFSPLLSLSNLLHNRWWVYFPSGFSGIHPFNLARKKKTRWQRTPLRSHTGDAVKASKWTIENKTCWVTSFMVGLLSSTSACLLWDFQCKNFLTQYVVFIWNCKCPKTHSCRVHYIAILFNVFIISFSNATTHAGCEAETESRPMSSWAHNSGGDRSTRCMDGAQEKNTDTNENQHVYTLHHN